MSNVEFIIGFLVIVITALILLAPMFVLRLKGNHRNGEEAKYKVTGSLLGKFSGSMVPTYRFSLFSDGILICGLFSSRFILLQDIKGVTRSKHGIRSCVEVNLVSGETLRIDTMNNTRFIKALS